MLIAWSKPPIYSPICKNLEVNFLQLLIHVQNWRFVLIFKSNEKYIMCYFPFPWYFIFLHMVLTIPTSHHQENVAVFIHLQWTMRLEDREWIAVFFLYASLLHCPWKLQCDRTKSKPPTMQASSLVMILKTTENAVYWLWDRTSDQGSLGLTGILVFIRGMSLPRL